MEMTHTNPMPTHWKETQETLNKFQTYSQLSLEWVAQDTFAQNSVLRVKTTTWYQKCNKPGNANIGSAHNTVCTI